VPGKPGSYVRIQRDIHGIIVVKITKITDLGINKDQGGDEPNADEQAGCGRRETKGRANGRSRVLSTLHIRGALSHRFTLQE
jgi:hypothetical protein